jgi:hypothetical protein
LHRFCVRMPSFTIHSRAWITFQSDGTLLLVTVSSLFLCVIVLFLNCFFFSLCNEEEKKRKWKFNWVEHHFRVQFQLLCVYDIIRNKRRAWHNANRSRCTQSVFVHTRWWCADLNDPN